ncbi:CYTH domain-containing protein, partial [Tibeticola sp.]|uniref:CYTH domain-containing protein n=1 Tax=Tibeticola sp. TaxID=2005368 RepID=UPI0025ED7112
MATETELKLQPAHARDLPRLLAHPRLAALEPQRERLVATYFDTPALDLLRARMAVRERREGRRHVATVKTAGLVIGGLSRRGEWEAPMPAGARRFASLVDDPALADWLRAREGALQPVFRTAFTRLRWQLAFEGARIEVALDHGAIVSEGPQGRAREPLLELELEVLEGPDDALFALALELAEALPLWPLAASKAERGYALFLRAQGSRPPPATPRPRASWPAATPADQVFAQLAHEVLDALAPPLRDAAHTRSRGSAEAAEAVHQSRVALRRLRALLGV